MHISQEAPSLSAAAAVAAAAFGQVSNEAYEAGIANVIREGTPFVALEADYLLGFAYFLVHEDILYIHATAVHPSAHRRGIVAQLIAAAQAVYDLPYLGWRTQSLKAFRAFSKQCTSVWPLGSDDELPDCMERATYLATLDGHAWPLAHRAYSDALFAEKPSGEDAVAQAWWDSLCSYEDGDAVYAVGRALSDTPPVVTVRRTFNPCGRVFESAVPIYPGRRNTCFDHVSHLKLYEYPTSEYEWEKDASRIDPQVERLARPIFRAVPGLREIFFSPSAISCYTKESQPSWTFQQEVAVTRAIETFMSATADAT